MLSASASSVIFTFSPRSTFRADAARENEVFRQGGGYVARDERAAALRKRLFFPFENVARPQRAFPQSTHMLSSRQIFVLPLHKLLL